MKTPNSNGVYSPDTTEEIARVGRAAAAVEVCLFDDGLHHYAVSFHSPTCGFGGPITLQSTGHLTAAEARLAGIHDLLRRLTGSPSDGLGAERSELVDQLQEAFRQPGLFDLIT